MGKIKQRTIFLKRYIYKYIWEHKIQILQGIPALVLFVMATYRLSDIGQPIVFNDEIGYWSNSAFFLGIDWASVTGRINYYAYGYSLLLVPLRLLSRVFYWGWAELYHAAVVMNACFLAMSYVIALQLAKRYLPGMNRLIRTMVCFTVCTYSSYLVYAHIAWTECTLMFFFWVFLYVMMRLTDRPTVGNHIVFAIVSFYIYMVHQRALGIVMAAVLMVLYMRILRKNSLRDTAVFLGSMYLCSLLHAMVKTNLQQVHYLGRESVGFRGLLSYAFTRRSLVFLAGGLILLLVLYLIENRKYKLLLVLLAMGVVLCAAFFKYGGILPNSAIEEDHRIAINDYSGQWGVIKNLFTARGLGRLGVSMAGKWFYVAAASGLVACWGIWGLFKNVWFLLRDSIEQIKLAYAKEAQEGENESGHKIEGLEDHIWLFGMFLAWFSTFMVSAIYKEGFYKNDDLFNGRYVEFTVGFILMYGFYCLLNDKKWVRTTVLYVILYIVAGKMCQDLMDELQLKKFQITHCLMFGRVFWNDEVPYGKVRALTEYVGPLSLSFVILLKLGREKLCRVAVVRAVLALMIPVAAWSYLGKTIVDTYVVDRNEKQEKPFVKLSSWIHVLADGEKVYYITDSRYERYPGLVQFMLQERAVTVVGTSDLSYQEDAFYIMKNCYWTEENTALTEECEVVLRSGGYTMAINRNQNLARRWDAFNK